QVVMIETAGVVVIGSSKKTAVVYGRLRAAGISEDKIAGVHTPIGLDIKATTPEEIAVSVTAEMVLVRAEKREDDGTKACPMSM
ncbi:MAG: XdhC family protein, partial [Mogibacterium sp.]|nr:XdhC family protein [Mogibacterium sp.]